MSKILLVNVSGRNGYSYKVLKEIEKGVNNSEYIKLSDYNIEFCKGCLYCNYNEKCVINDDLNEVINKIKDNDIIVFAIPNYFGGISGLFKNFIDRLHYTYISKKSIFLDKKVIFIYTGALEDDSITMEELTKSTYNIEKYLKINVVNRYSFSSSYELDMDKVNSIIDFLNK